MDDDWDALGGPVENTQPPPAENADPFGADDAFGGEDLVGTNDGFGDESQPAAAPSEDVFGGGDAPEGDNGLLGDDFGEEAQPSNAVPVAMDDDGLLGAPTSGSNMDMFDSSPAPQSSGFSNPAPVHEDNSILEAWEAENRVKLQKRREEALAKKSAQMEHAKKQIDEHENKRKSMMDSNQKKNQSDELEFVKNRDAALKAGLAGKDSWDKVCTYLDLSSDPKRNNLISRMKSVLIAVKTNPPATAKNFGA
ncbi:clathrin light chain [Guillardia theta CCMP2712]|uniref:Clathrin light chain n=1 Tax=Guillardia theta (strain CCMP2712) TaxID=905079 RepID=L1J7U5_GUITC|nr:clathrin light chain [Guillardia theta CCMP2712]EKX44608.1 clathrin light chain [Guillardia theta CCMP2712]|eukprot:XP_005831588.1 clathrin light chain [Guillardia theta CCMP2712]